MKRILDIRNFIDCQYPPKKRRKCRILDIWGFGYSIFISIPDLDLAIAASPPNKALSTNSLKKSPDSGNISIAILITMTKVLTKKFVIEKNSLYYEWWILRQN